MLSPLSWRSSLAIVATFALVLVGGPALAHHQDGHDGGPPEDRGQSQSNQGQSQSQSTVTEDTDDDGATDHPNAPDPLGDADNQHPSGKDKHVEAGGSGNQGWATTEPDQNGTGPERDVGGRDQPDGPGGADILDQDGNNGCGNDDDFEDDNEGNCGGRGGGGQGGGGQGGGGQGGGGNGGPPPTIVAAEEDAPVGIAGVPGGGGGGGGPAAAPPAPPARPVTPELAFTGANSGALLELMLALTLLGLAFVTAGRRLDRA